LQRDEAGFKKLAKAKTDTGILRCVQDDVKKLRSAKKCVQDGGRRQRHLGIGEEAVAYPTHGDEVLRVGGVVFDVAAESDDEVVDGAGVGVFVDVPDLFEDLFAGDDLTFAVCEVAEEVGLHEGEVRGAIGGDEFECVEADGAVVEGVLRWRSSWFGFYGLGGQSSLPCGATEKGLDANKEDVEIEGLGEVIVGSCFEAFQDLFGAGAGGEHQDWGEVLGFAERADDGEAVCAGEHAVEDDGGDGFFCGEKPSEGRVAVGLVVGAVTFGLEVEEEALGEVVLVFYNGDQRGD
jgi:hypothetical protein